MSDGPASEPPRAGSLAIVLHSHMPYVEGFGTYPFGEEWLFDAVLRSYIPVLDVARGVSFTVTPVLADQLEAPGVPERLERFARELRVGSCRAEAEAMEPQFRAACIAEAERYERALERLASVGGQPLALFREAAAGGEIAMMASCATHSVLPLVATDAARRLQIDVGLRSHRRRFGREAGFWLPECAYEPGLERLLAERSVPCFCVDQSRFDDPLDALTPIATPAGPTALPLDWEAIHWLWSLEGYPADPAHADFHRESHWGARAWNIAGEARDPAAGEARAREQAHEFLAAAARRFADYAARGVGEGLMVFAIDTELLGHWWWEGPAWLEEVVRAAPAAGIELVTVPQALERFEPRPRELRRSSWGEHKDLSTWDSPEVADLAWGARRLELRVLRELASRGLERARRERLVRELLAAQASDWTFLDKRGQAGDYPFARATGHARAAFDAIHCPDPPDPRLRNLAPDLSLSPLSEP